MKQPSNKLKYPIEQLIEKLKKLPPGTTYEEVKGELYGGETSDQDLGTGYQMRIDIVEGFDPPRHDEDEALDFAGYLFDQSTWGWADCRSQANDKIASKPV